MRILTVMTAAAFLVASAAADTLVLKSGASQEGTFLGGNSREVEFLLADGSVKRYPVADVAEISFQEIQTAEVQAPSAPSAPAAPVRPAQAGDRAPAGTPVVVRTIDSIESDATGVGERYRVSLEEAIVVDGREIAPRGADAWVEVSQVEEAGRVRGRSEIALELAAITIDGREYVVDTNYAQVEGDGKTMKTAKRAGVGAAAGAIIGAIAGGGSGAAIGAGVGAGAGTVYSATKGERVRIPSETVLSFSLREDLVL